MSLWKAARYPISTRFSFLTIRGRPAYYGEEMSRGRNGPPIMTSGSARLQTHDCTSNISPFVLLYNQNPVANLDDLLLFAATTGNSHNGIGLVQLWRGHKRSPAAKIWMTTGSSENRIVVNPALENRVTENRRNLERYSESSHDFQRRFSPLRVLAAS